MSCDILFPAGADGCCGACVIALGLVSMMLLFTSSVCWCIEEGEVVAVLSE